MRMLTLAGLALVGLSTIACTTDIRPDALDGGISATAAADGRAWVERMEKAHGGVEAFRAFGDAEFVLADHWPSWLPRVAAMPWGKDGQTMRLDVQTTNDNARLTFLDGPDAGAAWGLQNWVTYRVPKGGEPVFSEDEDEDVWFWVPTVAYFVVMPWRIGEADVVAYAGETTIGGEHYAVVLATWGRAEPQDDVDQYVLYIHHETHRLDYAAYTIRDMALATKGAVRYRDFRDVQGLLVPFGMTMGGAPEGDDVTHEMILDSARFAPGRPAAHYVPDPGRAQPK